MDKLEENKKIIMQHLNISNEKYAFDLMKKKSKEYIKLMSYYKCAMMEIETKFNVLNEEFSLEVDRNPISSIKTRLNVPKALWRSSNAEIFREASTQLKIIYMTLQE